MVAVSNPFGIRPAFSPQGMAAATSYPNGIASGYGTGILKYQPVALNSSGNIIAATNSADIKGVFAGLFYVDASGIPHEVNQWVAGQTYSNTNNSVAQGYGINVFVWDDPNMVYSIQADGSLAQSIGGQVNFSNIAAGSTTTGLSACTAGAASLTTSAQAQLRIVTLDPTINNSWGDAFTVVQVKIAQDQYVANKVAV